MDYVNVTIKLISLVDRSSHCSAKRSSFPRRFSNYATTSPRHSIAINSLCFAAIDWACFASSRREGTRKILQTTSGADKGILLGIKYRVGAL